MSNNDAWIDDVRSGRAKEAIDYLRKELQNPGMYPSNYYSLGAVYMWAGDYQLALAHFDQQIRAALPSNAPADSTFGMAGAAAWCLGETKLGIKYWREGTTAGYAVAGANTRTELLLYAASVLKPSSFSAESAEELLLTKVSHWRVKNWPGPIAQYILGAASDEEVQYEALRTHRDLVRPNPNSWLFEFYKLAKIAASADTARVRLENDIRTLLDVEGSEYLAGVKLFSFLGVEEFYLARHWLLEIATNGC
jgi:tetratricopeptide (TPR) repeat protein